jgi:hypothetical protein
MGWLGHVVHTEEKRDAYRLLEGKHEGRVPYEILGFRWEDNIKMDLKEMAWEDENGINLAVDRNQRQAFLSMEHEP